MRSRASPSKIGRMSWFGGLPGGRHHRAGAAVEWTASRMGRRSRAFLEEGKVAPRVRTTEFVWLATKATSKLEQLLDSGVDPYAEPLAPDQDFRTCRQTSAYERDPVPSQFRLRIEPAS